MVSDRFVSPCPLPTPVEREIIETLAEEAAEAIQRATKLLRFGVNEVQPGQPHSNGERLGHEIGDFLAMVDYAVSHGMLSYADIDVGRYRKPARFEKYRQFRMEPANG